MTELHATDQTLPARIASIERASADLVTLLEQACATVGDPRALAVNRDQLLENLQLGLSYSKRIREAIS